MINSRKLSDLRADVRANAELLLAERERVRQERLRMWREQTGGAVPFEEWQLRQLRIWDSGYNNELSDVSLQRVARRIRRLDGDCYVGLRPNRRTGDDSCYVLGESEEDDLRMILYAPVRPRGA
jgi:hypothetical protein